MLRLPFLHISHGVSAPPETPNKTLERNRHSGVVSVFFHSGEIVGFGGVALSWRSLSSALGREGNTVQTSALNADCADGNFHSAFLGIHRAWPTYPCEVFPTMYDPAAGGGVSMETQYAERGAAAPTPLLSGTSDNGGFVDGGLSGVVFMRCFRGWLRLGRSCDLVALIFGTVLKS
jgi:hypothetical protein